MDKFSTPSRLSGILEILQEKQSATVDYLAKALYSSPSTIRRDLNTLEAQGYIRRFHGGAAITGRPVASLPIHYRIHDMAEEKKKIGLAALSLVENGNTIFIDSSSTAATMIPHLSRFEKLRIVTNSALSLEAILDLDFDVYVIGGQLLRRSNAFVGSFATDMLSHFHIDKSFFSTASLSPTGWLCNNTEDENNLRRCALQNSTENYFLVDSSKVGVYTMLHLCHLRDLTGVISDADLPNLLPWESDYPKFYLAK